MLDPVATTGLLVAAIRAEETVREHPLFRDPFAAGLAGEAGRSALANYRAANAGPDVPIIEVRTRYYDEALTRDGDDGFRQFVLVAAGMDARAYRLAWPAGTRVFEIDQPDVLAAKEKLLAAAVPTCQRRAVGIDLANDWPAALQSAGFDPTERTAWIIEGLLQYLDEAAVAPLFARVDALSASGSRLHYDVVGRSLLESPAVAGMLRMMSDLGAPWRFGTDDPAALVEPRGWDAEVTEPAIVGNRLGRWPFPPAPPGTPGVPRGYLVDAAKR